MQDKEKDNFLKPLPKTNAEGQNEFPMIGGPQRASVGTQRKKTPLQPGYSPLDWAELKTSGKDLTGGVGQLKRYTLTDLQEHKSKEDMWMAYRGKVYNITPYLNYHPGGVPQLRRGAGKDATQLITEIHPWVNIELMLDKCFIGYLVSEQDQTIESIFKDLNKKILHH